MEHRIKQISPLSLKCRSNNNDKRIKYIMKDKTNRYKCDLLTYSLSYFAYICIYSLISIIVFKNV